MCSVEPLRASCVARALRFHCEASAIFWRAVGLQMISWYCAHCSGCRWIWCLAGAFS